MLTSEKNRTLNCLTVSNLKLDDVFSDVFGKSSRSIIMALIERPGDEIDVTPLLKKNCKHTAEEIAEAIKGCELSEAQREKLIVCLQHMDEIDTHIAEVEKDIQPYVESYKDSLDLLRTIPGLGGNGITAVTILSELGDDMSVFPTAKNLTSWAGCCPRNDSSASKVKRTRTSHAGSNLKPTLVQVANGLVRSKKHPEFGVRYRRIKARHGHQKAIIAICRMLLVAIWHVLKNHEAYNPLGYPSDKKAGKPSQATLNGYIAVLRKNGIQVIVPEEEQKSTAEVDQKNITENTA